MTDPFERCRIFGINLCVADLKGAVSYVAENTAVLRGKYICFCNVHTAVTARSDRHFLEAENGAALTFTDGKPLAEEEKKRGFDHARRVAGPDFMAAVFRVSQKAGLRHFFYGASQETLDALKNALLKNYPGIDITGMYSPPFRQLSDGEDAEALKMINDAKPDIVWVGLGAPKQEKWMAEHAGKINGVMIGVGAGFAFLSGKVKRAPRWMQRAGLEWLFRLIQDPGRLTGRYLYTNTEYLLNVGRDRRRERRQNKNG